MKLAAELIVRATGARITGQALEGKVFSGVSTDSRQVGQGEIFLALKGPNFDGHAFCRDAIALGATGLIVAGAISDVPANVTVFRVDDTLAAYQAVARAYRRSLPALKVFAVTGSNGKTSTKDLLAACLASKYKVAKTQGNFNNEIGLPKTLLSVESSTDFVVTEMGMRGLGQIAELCSIALPDCGLITNVSETHLELLGSIANIAKAKGELTQALSSDGLAVVNGDDAWAVKAAAGTRARTVYFGLNKDADYSASDISTQAAGSNFICTEKATGRQVPVRLQLIGEHNVYNAVAAIAAAVSCGVPLEAAAAALATARLTGSRQEISYLGDLTFINDAYNASPASMLAALKTLNEAKRSSGGRSLAVLADMLELGEISEAAHRRVGQQAAEQQVDFLLTYGELARYTSEEAAKCGVSTRHCPDRAAAAAVLRSYVRAGDIILLKGSRALAVDKILDTFK